MGSSPLTRGKLPGGLIAARAGRLIPAHAGKTCVGMRTRGAARAHPRSRGENYRLRLLALGCGGSSPLTRGKQFVDRRSEIFAGSSPLTRGKQRVVPSKLTMRGLIPAHAGKTSMRFAVRRASWAHPRSRGENTLNLSTC